MIKPGKNRNIQRILQLWILTALIGSLAGCAAPVEQQAAPTPTATPPTVQATQPPETAATEAAATPEMIEEIDALSAQLGWQVVVPRQPVEGYKLASVHHDQEHNAAALTYQITRPLPGSDDPEMSSSCSITLFESLRDDFIPMQISPEAQTSAETVNGRPAQYFTGAWDAQFAANDQDADGGEMEYTWRNDLDIQNLYWQVEGMYFALITDDVLVSREELVAMAESIGEP